MKEIHDAKLHAVSLVTHPPHPDWRIVSVTELCARCGQPLRGLGIIDGKRYCHDGDEPTCYMLECWEQHV